MRATRKKNYAVTRHSLLFIAAIISFGASPVCAQENGEIRLYIENDFFNPLTEGTDKYYTNGIRIEYIGPAKSDGTDFLPGVDAGIWCVICGKGAEDGLVRTGYSIGQNIYTPADISVTRRQPFDRPYAGFLYASRIAQIEYPDETLNAQRMDRAELTLGIVGPAALAGETQRWWHRIIGAQRPQGWQYQLRNEPIVQLGYETALRWPPEDGGNADFIPRVRAKFGNAFISVEGELRGRIGWNLEGFGVGGSFGKASPAPMEAGLAAPVRSGASGQNSIIQSFAIFARVNGSAIARNIFLDGNTFTDNDLRINRKPFVGEAAFGFEARVFSRLLLSAQFIRRSSEFTDFRGRSAPHQDFGSLTLGYRW